jgi:hypothetical protein
MKKLAPIMICALLFTGCTLNKKAADLIEKSYSVTVRGETAIEYVIGQLEGSELGLKVQKDLESVQKALAALRSTLETVAGFVGADLTVVAVASVEPIPALDDATEELLRALEE